LVILGFGFQKFKIALTNFLKANYGGNRDYYKRGFMGIAASKLEVEC
jgi:hypothetical protein